jgi:predicted O-methyltransferase YrrM
VGKRTINLDEHLYQYLLDVSVREPGIMARLRQETAEMANAGMQISPDQGQFMALLVKLMGARRCLEVGVFTGYSALAVARALPPDGIVIGCDINGDWTRIAQRYWREAGVQDRIELRLGPALETLDALLDAGESGAFDFAFIDADKREYRQYYESTLALLRPGGLVAVDNVLWNGSVIDDGKQDDDTRAIRAFNDFLSSDERVDLSLVAVGDGLTLARKR